MSERLSRMDRHPSTRKKRRKRPTFKQEWQDNQMRLSDTTVMRLSDLENREASTEPSVLPPSAVSAIPVGETRAGRIKNSWAVSSEPAAQPANTEEDTDSELPPRSVMYPSSRIRLTKWFYETLILLFLILLGTLLWWGTQTTGVKWPWQ